MSTLPLFTPAASGNTETMLAIDTCTRRASIALRDAHQVRAELTWECERAETATVSARIQDLCATSHIDPSTLGAVAVAIGPGSYTGVRCGLAIAKGIALALKIPILGVNAFDVIVNAQPATRTPLLAVLEIGRKRVAVCPYQNMGGKLLTGEWKLLDWPDLNNAIFEPTWVCGDLPAELQTMLAHNASARVAPAPLNMRRAGHLAELAYRRWRSGEVDDVMTLTAIYPPD
jgi:tRNA threonylcarbamoyladenosine biosynthesis protein TsaB